MEGKCDAAFLETVLQTLEAETSLQVPVGDGAPCAHSVPVPRCGGAGQPSCRTPEGLDESHPADTERWRRVAYDSCCFPAKATGCNGRACRRRINIEL